MKGGNVMKKSLFSIFKSCTLFLVICAMITISINATEESIETRFNELQDEITESLDIDEENDKYIYNANYISSLVNNFDVDELNDFYETDYTKESLTSFIIYRLDTVKPSQAIPTPLNSTEEINACSANSTYCGRNFYSTGWNYERFFTERSITQTWIRYLREGATQAMFEALLGAATSGTSAASWALTFMSAASGLWKNGFAKALEYNNNLSNCGVVADINTFTTAYTVWSQPNFPG